MTQPNQTEKSQQELPQIELIQNAETENHTQQHLHDDDESVTSPRPCCGG